MENESRTENLELYETNETASHIGFAATMPLVRAASDEAYDQLADAINALPVSVRELVRIAGISAALALVKAYGGTEVIFPKGVNPDAQSRYEEMAELVGYAAADKLAKYGNGIKLYIPRCHTQLIALRNVELRREFDRMTSGGASRREATPLKVSANRVYRNGVLVTDGEYSNAARRTSGEYSSREAVSKLARRYGMSDRNVWRLLKTA